MPPSPLESSQKGQPWPGYFLVRTTGEVVPLIAVDELPPGIELVDIPRSLGLEETIGMLNLGLQRSTGSHYQIVSDDDTSDGHHSLSTKAKQAIFTTLPLKPPPKSVPAARTTTPTSTPPSTLKATSTIRAGVSNMESQTVLCRHWCRHGVCKWGQQCRYRHIMPMTLQGLQEVGLADWPAWYRKLNPGYFVNEAQGPGTSTGRGSGARTRACTAGGGHGGACCGALHGGRSERRVAGNRGVIERGIKYSKSEELGEQIIARLRGMAKDGKANAGEKGNVMIERAAARDTKNWEDENEDSDDCASEPEVQHVEEVKGKLVDV
ncbi:uncharacterized protein PAC_11948 [Phialocephala subalpina]|uniref:C3H1-type domain-containing protein n=1 Tax=Phialocephala subalpina TaxID=576137 RepID=A0A1L7XAK0_9HELO|nr:uncharacterized protein PAC_11948 [Phialocephala subalpina]